MSESVYYLTLNLFMIVKMVSLLFLTLIVLCGTYFDKYRVWQAVFTAGAVITILGLAGDLTDGPSTLNQLRLWAWMRHLGVAILLLSVIGLHRTKFMADFMRYFRQ